jgi:hypothetical protein
MNRAALACILVTFSFAAACGGERQGGVNAPVSPMPTDAGAISPR